MAKDLDLGLFLATQAKDYNGVKERIEIKPKVKVKAKTKQKSNDFGMGM